MNNQFKNPTFGGFKPNAMQRIAGTLGYTGEMSGFNSYLEQNPDKKNQMEQFKQAAMMMAKGGAVQKFQTGGTPNYMGSDFKNVSSEDLGFKAPTSGMHTQGMKFYYNPTTQQRTSVMGGGYEVPEGFIQGNSSGYQDPNQQYSPQYNNNNLSSNTNMQNAMNQFNQSQAQPAMDERLKLLQQQTQGSLDQQAQQPAQQGQTLIDIFGEKPPDAQLLPYQPPQQAQQPAQQGQTVQQNAAGSFDIVDASGKVIKTNIDTAEQAQQMTGGQYQDTSIPVSMPEPLPEPDFSTGYVLPDYAEGQLKDVVTGGTDLSNITLVR